LALSYLLFFFLAAMGWTALLYHMFSAMMFCLDTGSKTTKPTNQSYLWNDEPK
jgi:hypothetical protein